MIPLKINGKKHLVPTISELSTRQYIDLVNKGDYNLIDYLAIALGMSPKLTAKLKIKNPAFLESQLYPTFPDYSKFKAKNFFVVNGRRYNLSQNFTLGQVFEIEENGKNLKDFEMMVFVLAVNADQDNYNKLLSEIYKKKACEVLPDAFFLLKNLRIGRYSKMIYTILRAWLILTNYLRKRRA